MKQRSRLVAGSAFAVALCAFLAQWEGRSLIAYRDIVGVLTICYGDTRNVREGQTATAAECDERLMRELIVHEDGMRKCLTREIPKGPHFAFLSLTYNIGVDAICRSTLMRKLNAGDIDGACNEILRWNKAGIPPREVRGLTNRRKAEHEICMRPDLRSL